MRRLFCAASIAVLVASSAHAASPLTSTSPIAYNWTGFYIGANGGFGGQNFNYPFTLGGTSGKLNLTSSGGFGGVQAGYNWQLRQRLVAGLEADIAASNIKGNASISLPGGSLSAGSTVTYFGTFRGRVGWTNGPLLIYGTAGFAYGSTHSAVSLTGLGTLAKTNNHTGWTVGAGVEYALTSRLSLKTEYKYVSLGTRGLASGGAGSLSETTRFHTLLIGLNYRF